jgi:ketosteroid isomerase-like protein
MLLILTMATPLTTLADNHGAVEAEIRELTNSFNEAYATNQVDKYFSFYAKDVSLYFFGARQSVEQYNKEWHEMVAAGGGVERNDASDLQVRVLPGGEAAVVTYFVNNQSRSPDGKVTSAKAFETEVWEKINGDWKIVSLHYTEIVPE